MSLASDSTVTGPEISVLLRATPHGRVESDSVQYQVMDCMSCIPSHTGPVSQLAGMSGVLRRARKAGSMWRKHKSTVHREAGIGMCQAGPSRGAGTRGGGRCPAGVSRALPRAAGPSARAVARSGKKLPFVLWKAQSTKMTRH